MAKSILLNKLCESECSQSLIVIYWTFMKYGKESCTHERINEFEEEIHQYFLEQIEKEHLFTDRCWNIASNEAEYKLNMRTLLSCYHILSGRTDKQLVELCDQLYFLKKKGKIILYYAQDEGTLPLADDVRECMQSYLFQKLLAFLYDNPNHTLEDYYQYFMWANNELPTELPIEIVGASYTYSSDVSKPIDISLDGLLAIIKSERKIIDTDDYEFGKNAVKQLYQNLIQNRFLSPHLESKKLNTEICCFMHNTLAYLGYPNKDTSGFKSNRDKRKAIRDYINSRI